MANKDDDDAQDNPAPLTDEEGNPLEEGGGGGKKKLILLIVAPLLVLVGGGAGLYFSGALDQFLAPKEEEHAAAEGEHAPAVDEHGNPIASGGPVFLAIPDMIVNLSSTDSQPRYLRLKVQLEMENQADMTAVEQVLPRVVDQFQTYLRELRVKDLKGSAGIYRLQMELLSRVNAAAYPVVVKDVLFQEILIQ
jgi:flagellar FliL protein